MLLRDTHSRQQRTGQLSVLGAWLLGREQLREPALELVELGAFVLPEAEEPTRIGADDRQQPLLAVACWPKGRGRVPNQSGSAPTSSRWEDR